MAQVFFMSHNHGWLFPTSPPIAPNDKLFKITVIVAAALSLTLACILLCGLVYGFLLVKEAEGYLPLIQQALDEQCGEGVIIADIEGFDSDPMPVWYGRGANCRIVHEGRNGFECNCPTQDK